MSKHSILDFESVSLLRPAISMFMLREDPEIAEPMAKNASEPRITGRRPNICARPPKVSGRISEIGRYTVSWSRLQTSEREKCCAAQAVPSPDPNLTCDDRM